jgi:lipopolysaccharide transport system permease protein
MAVVIVAVGIFAGFQNPLVLVTLVPSLALIFVFAWSLSVCTATLNVLFHDTQHLLEILLQILFYVTPIIYEPKVLIEKNLGWAVDYNPFAVLLELIRQPLLHGTLETATVRSAILVTAATVCVAAMLLRWCERRLVFYL